MLHFFSVLQNVLNPKPSYFDKPFVLISFCLFHMLDTAGGEGIKKYITEYAVNSENGNKVDVSAQ